MSILVHPDKNQDDAERAQQAFESKYKTEIQFKKIYHYNMINKKNINCSC